MQFSIHALWGRQSSGSFFKPLPPKPRAMLPGSQKAGRGDRLVSHRCTNGCADTDLWNWVAVSDWGNLSCSSGAQGWIPLKVQTALCSSVCIRCRQPPLTLSRALGPFFCWVSRACLTMETHMGEVFEAAFFSPHLISPSLKLLSPPLVLLWVVSSNFCSPKAEIWVMLYLNIDLHSAVGVGFPPFCERFLHSSHKSCKENCAGPGFWPSVFHSRFFSSKSFQLPSIFFPSHAALIAWSPLFFYNVCYVLASTSLLCIITNAVDGINMLIIDTEHGSFGLSRLFLLSPHKNWGNWMTSLFPCPKFSKDVKIFNTCLHC